MLWAMGLLGGWKQVRTSAGWSYEVSRGGKRRVVAIDGYRNRGMSDQQWIDTGNFADDRVAERFREFEIVGAKPKLKRAHAAA